MVVGSVSLAFSSLLLAYPAAVGICCFARGLGPPVPARLLMGLVHFMTSIPTVVYGFVSVFLIVPLVRNSFDAGTGFSLLSASVTLALLILPTIALLINAQMDQVAPQMVQTCGALGLTKAQELLWVVLPSCRRGLIAAAVLGFGRAMGDTLVSLMVAGNAPQLPDSPLDAIRTLTAHIALVLATDVHSSAYASLFACGLILFCVTAAVNVGLRWIEKPSRADGRGSGA
jgi:phosphate transport system permease protein